MYYNQLNGRKKFYFLVFFHFDSFDEMTLFLGALSVDNIKLFENYFICVNHIVESGNIYNGVYC